MQSKQLTNDYNSFLGKPGFTIFDDTNIDNNESNDEISEVSVSLEAVSRIDADILKRVDYLDDHYKSRLITMIYHEDFFPGESNETIVFVSSLRRYSEVALVLWFNKLYTEYLNIPPVLRGILYIILYFHFIFRELLITTALAAISNESCEVQELGVRMLESICCKEHYEALKCIKKQESWLQCYIDRVKEDFKKQLCRS